MIERKSDKNNLSFLIDFFASKKFSAGKDFKHPVKGKFLFQKSIPERDSRNSATNLILLYFAISFYSIFHFD